MKRNGEREGKKTGIDENYYKKMYKTWNEKNLNARMKEVN